MSLELIRQNIIGLQAAMAALEAATVDNTEKRLRVSSRMAKNLNPGDVIQWPYPDEKVEIIGWGMVGGEVLVSRRSGGLASFAAEERVRVYR